MRDESQLLARDAFVRPTRYCHDVRPSVCLGRACIVITRYTLAPI